jgi:hypothetical protein
MEQADIDRLAEATLASLRRIKPRLLAGESASDPRDGC